jgi:hypothetical protein
MARVRRGGSLTGKILAALLAIAVPLAAQEPTGSGGSAAAGAALGAYSGFVLGGAAAWIPCNQTISGIGCLRTGAGIGAGLGLASGIALGLADSDAIGEAYGRAGIGLVGGSLVVAALGPFLDRWSWKDVVAGGVIGSSIAAGSPGAWIGLVLGTGVGVGLWQLIPGVELPDAVSAGLLGMAFGGITSWIVSAVEADADGSPASPAVLSIHLAVP